MQHRFVIARGDGYAFEITQDPEGPFKSRQAAAAYLRRHLEADQRELDRALRRLRRIERAPIAPH